MGESAPEQLRRVVLVVDDEEQVRNYMARILSDAGHHVLVAHDGLAALGVIESCAGALHLVVTDVNMPRMSGLELAARMNQRWPDIPILFVTGRGLPPDALVAPHLNKPFLPDALAVQAQSLLVRADGAV